eukprot:Pgem_evm1s11543
MSNNFNTPFYYTEPEIYNNDEELGLKILNSDDHLDTVSFGSLESNNLVAVDEDSDDDDEDEASYYFSTPRKAKSKFNYNKWFWLAFLWGVSLALFLWKFLTIMHHHHLFSVASFGLCVSRSTAEACKFQTAILILFMCRACLTKLRVVMKGRLVRYLPLDYSIEAHKMIGISFLVLMIIHTFGHVYNAYVLANMTAEQHAEATLTLQQQTGKEDVVAWKYYGKSMAYLVFVTPFGITGVVMWLLMIIGYGVTFF